MNRDLFAVQARLNEIQSQAQDARERYAEPRWIIPGARVPLWTRLRLWWERLLERLGWDR